MTISRKALVIALLLSAVLPLISNSSWAQGKNWTDEQCRDFMRRVFKDALDPTVDISEVTQHLGTRAATDFVVQCRIREKHSLERLEGQWENFMDARQKTPESEWRVNRYGKHVENFKSQTPIYDPGGLPTRAGPGTN